MVQTAAPKKQTSDEEKIPLIYQFAADLFRRGSSSPDIVRALQDKGLDGDSAKVVVEDLRKMNDSLRDHNGRQSITQGAVWLGGGAAVTAFTYWSASSGGSYLVAWGAIIYGLYLIARGAMMSR